MWRHTTWWPMFLAMLASPATGEDRPRLDRCLSRYEGLVDKPCIGRSKSRAMVRVASSGGTDHYSSEVLAALPVISDCYDEALHRSHAERGGIALRAKVDPTGKPGEVSGEVEGLGDQKLVECIKSAVGALRLSNPGYAPAANVRLTVVLTPPPLRETPRLVALRLCAIASNMVRDPTWSRTRPGVELATRLYVAEIPREYLQLLEATGQKVQLQRYATWIAGLQVLGVPGDSTSCDSLRQLLEM